MKCFGVQKSPFLTGLTQYLQRVIVTWNDECKLSAVEREFGHVHTVESSQLARRDLLYLFLNYKSISLKSFYESS